MSTKLEIFAFKNCGNTILCDKAYSSVLGRMKILQAVLLRERPSLGGSEINIVLTEEENIRSLNKDFRKKDCPTDVLAFPLGEGSSGEVWICPDVVFQNASSFSQDFETELLRIVIHGILHLSGMDHEKPFGKDDKSEMEEMYVVQEKLLRLVEGSDKK